MHFVILMHLDTVCKYRVLRVAKRIKTTTYSKLGNIILLPTLRPSSHPTIVVCSLVSYTYVCGVRDHVFNRIHVLLLLCIFFIELKLRYLRSLA